MRLTGTARLLRRTGLLRGRKARKRRAALRSGAGLLIGAGGLLLFIVGLKRTHRLDDRSGTMLAEETGETEVRDDDSST